MRILVVDDSKATLEIVRRSLEGFNYRSLSIKKTQSPVDALTIIGQWQPHILLTDWNMPDLSGLDLIKAIRKRGFTTQIGMLTTIDTEKELNLAQKAGANFVLSKPFDDEQLHEKLKPLVQCIEQDEISFDPEAPLSDGLALPNLDTLTTALQRVVGQQLKVNKIKAQAFDESKLPCIMAIFEDSETQKVRSVALLDLYAACSLVRNHPDITIGHLQRIIKTKRPSKYLMDVCHQNLSKASVAFLDHQSRKNLRLKNLNFVETSFTKLENMYKSPLNKRIDISCQIEPLAQGRMTIIGF